MAMTRIRIRARIFCSNSERPSKPLLHPVSQRLFVFHLRTSTTAKLSRSSASSSFTLSQLWWCELNPSYACSRPALCSPLPTLSVFCVLPFRQARATWPTFLPAVTFVQWPHSAFTAPARMRTNFCNSNSNPTVILKIGPQSLTQPTHNFFLAIDVLTHVCTSPYIYNLGVTFDPTLSFDNHVNFIITTAFLHLKNIACLPSIPLYLPAAETPIHASPPDSTTVTFIICIWFFFCCFYCTVFL